MTMTKISHRELWRHVRNYRNLKENDAELQSVLTDYFAQRGIRDEEHIRMHLEGHQLLRDEIQEIRNSPRAQQLQEQEWQRWIPLLGLKRQFEDGGFDSIEEGYDSMSKACNSDSHRHTNDEILDQIYGRPYNMANGVYNMVAASAVFFGAVTAVSSLVEKLF